MTSPVGTADCRPTGLVYLFAVYPAINGWAIDILFLRNNIPYILSPFLAKAITNYEFACLIHPLFFKYKSYNWTLQLIF